MILCNQVKFELNDILKTSKTISDLTQHISGDNFITLPDEYFLSLNHLNSEKLKDQILLLKLYDFLNVEEKYISILCYIIGEKIRTIF